MGNGYRDKLRCLLVWVCPLLSCASFMIIANKVMFHWANERSSVSMRLALPPLARDGWMEILTLGSLAPSGQASKGQRRRGPRRGRETEEKVANGGVRGREK